MEHSCIIHEFGIFKNSPRFNTSLTSRAEARVESKKKTFGIKKKLQTTHLFRVGKETGNCLTQEQTHDIFEQVDHKTPHRYHIIALPIVVGCTCGVL